MRSTVLACAVSMNVSDSIVATVIQFLPLPSALLCGQLSRGSKITGLARGSENSRSVLHSGPHLEGSPFVPRTLMGTPSGLALCPAFDQQFWPGQALSPVS